MNFAFLVSSISSIILSIISPITPLNTTPSLLDATSTKAPSIQMCYSHNKLMTLGDNQTTDIFQNDNRKIIRCNNNREFCGINITQKEFANNYTITFGCITKESCDEERQSAKHRYRYIFPFKYIDYENYNSINFNDCCSMSWCNNYFNHYLIVNMLKSRALQAKDHDKICPGYSKTNQVFKLQLGKLNIINVEEGANLLLVLDTIKDPYKKKVYLSTDVYINEKVAYKVYDDKKKLQADIVKKNEAHTFIKNNKLFYFTDTSMHFCNLTKDDSLRIAIFHNYLLLPQSHNTKININVGSDDITTTPIIEEILTQSTIKNNSINACVILTNNILAIFLTSSLLYLINI
jgi:hypothetical protein